MKTETYDVIVIGTGSGASVAHKCAKAGKKVAIIDCNPYGGTCQLRGCDPKKVLVGISQALDMSNRLLHKGVTEPAKLSWKDMMQFKHTFTDPTPSKNDQSLIEAGVKTFHGRAAFQSENILKVNSKLLKADKFVLANGAKPAKLSIPGEEFLIDSTAFLSLNTLPDELLLVGGGYIAFEFGHLAARMGVKVKIIHRGKMPLENFDQDMVTNLLTATRLLGIELILDTEVKAIVKENDRLVVHAEAKDKEISFMTSLAVHAAGRTADIDDMQLEKANVAYGKKGVEVNDYLQSVSNPNVYACGDVNNKGLPLTPVGAKEAIIVASNLLKGNHTEIDYGHIPSNVFTIPALAMVGLTEQLAKSQGLNYKVNYEETTGWFASKRLNEPISAYKILLDKDTNQVLGAHLLGPHAEDVINVFAVAMNGNITGDQLKKMIFSYPTNASDIVYML
ncbi:NAD(P)/FAD-dependent oxidoreductase [Mucilaginibacter rubeus]|uniref:NAD(P)/FAD-dependent oxidoreductase n=1 Tax=Mucilaginibacter rubeus TaxID=2027860 RepID=A0AAE6MKF8_9SPHI|nr:MULTISPECIES: NAD(P)/FAD-dependent oxidoreductase [Mucilaginibacter]QEM06665.1 NAD(P)/FAD-dependent oxidoreductase [Mucilaginibacter rubeus]QEM19254.1 NAD(P)/FAD-dependent oxidoreductase [Mucilaginibacter gossypii]QTE44200.1 NAD(P)/FAD-dependent oxidoreductase [Mucilaginibacter rubeus]QTE50801.1 NAD(P)/FAD-dependent oxidoreductase [Mucilaginibacter rubeus]QTE55884.1 NAD(P)/FAD-dependent oxidoreductase [Mucilaginibacter rubeus]